MSAFKDAFAKAGLTKADNEFSLAIAKFLNSGGTIARCHALVDQAAAKMAGKAHQTVDAHIIHGDSRQPHPEAGHPIIETQLQDAGTRDPIPGSGHIYRDDRPPRAADQEPKPARADQPPIEAPSASVRPGRVPEARIIPRSVLNNQRPSPERMKATREAGHSSVATIYDRFKLPDGRRIGDVRVSEYRHLAATNIRFASLFLRLDDIAMQRGKLGPSVTTRDLLKAKELEKVVTDSGIIDIEKEARKGILIEPNGRLSLIQREAIAP